MHMDLDRLQSDLRRLAEIVGSWDASKEIDALERDLVLEKRPNAKIVRQIVGPVIGSHCGPGTLGVVFVGAKRPVPLNG